MHVFHRIVDLLENVDKPCVHTSEQYRFFFRPSTCESLTILDYFRLYRVVKPSERSPKHCLGLDLHPIDSAKVRITNRRQPILVRVDAEAPTPSLQSLHSANCFVMKLIPSMHTSLCSTQLYSYTFFCFVLYVLAHTFVMSLF